MPSLDEVYRKFGETSETAQVFETELGTMLLHLKAMDEDLLITTNPERASAILEGINRLTLGRIISKLKKHAQPGDGLDELTDLFVDALAERNRLSHSFYRQHNLRINSDEGRELMLGDLNSIHTKLTVAYKALMKLSGTDLDDPASVIDALKVASLLQVLFTPVEKFKEITDHLPI